MGEFEPIEISTNWRSFDYTAEGRLRIVAPLVPAPEAAWIGLFHEREGERLSNDLERPFLQSGTVEIVAAEKDLDRYLTELREIVGTTNKEFVERIVPDQKRQAEEAAKTEADRVKRLDEAKGRARQLLG